MQATRPSQLERDRQRLCQHPRHPPFEPLAPGDEIDVPARVGVVQEKLIAGHPDIDAQPLTVGERGIHSIQVDDAEIECEVIVGSSRTGEQGDVRSGQDGCNGPHCAVATPHRDQFQRRVVTSRGDFSYSAVDGYCSEARKVIDRRFIVGLTRLVVVDQETFHAVAFLVDDHRLVSIAWT